MLISVVARQSHWGGTHGADGQAQGGVADAQLVA